MTFPHEAADKGAHDMGSGLSPLALPLGGRPVLTQHWLDLTFLHWAVDPATVRPLLPAGTEPDVHEGVTYVVLVPFRLVGAGLGTGPGVPYVGTFLETNVRLYSVDAQGRHGVVFRSLEASRLLTVLFALGRYRLPYVWARMRYRRRGDVVTYQTRRRWPGPAGTSSRVSVRIGPPIARPSALEVFLTARWGLHAAWKGRGVWIPNTHAPWPLHRAELLECDDQLVAAAGLPVADCPPLSVLWSPGVRARFGRPVPLDAPAPRSRVRR